VLNNTKTQSRPKLLFLVPAISQTHKKSWKFSRLFCQDQDQDQDSGSQDQDQDQDYFLSSRRLETKTLVSRTTSLVDTSLNSVCRYVPLLLLQALFGIVLLIHGMHCQQTLCLPHLWQCLKLVWTVLICLSLLFCFNCYFCAVCFTLF